MFSLNNLVTNDHHYYDHRMTSVDPRLSYSRYYYIKNPKLPLNRVEVMCFCKLCLLLAFEGNRISKNVWRYARWALAKFFDSTNLSLEKNTLNSTWRCTLALIWIWLHLCFRTTFRCPKSFDVARIFRNQNEYQSLFSEIKTVLTKN